MDSAPVETTPIVDDDYVEAPFVHEQTSQFEVCESSNARNAATASGQSNQAPSIASHVAVPNIPPRPRMNFVKPRQRSERIFKRKLAKNIGSSNSNGFDME